MMYPTKRPWGIDISGWNDPPPNYRKLVEHGATFAFVKGSMGGGIATNAQKQVYDLRNAGFKYVGVYHWADPIHITPDSQLKHIERIINLVKPDMISIDNEQWWASWNAYYQYQRGEISAAAVPKLSPLHISTFGRKLMRRVHDNFGLPTVNYTADWFIRSWSPQMREWINEFDLWFALYPFGSTRWQSWQQFYDTVSNSNPTIPQGATKWKFWQITDRKYLPDFPARYLDLNIFNGSHVDMDAWIGKQPVPVPAEPPKQEPYFEEYQNKRALLGMIVRDAPNGNRVTPNEWIWLNQKFKVYSKVVHPPYTWGKISPDKEKWVALAWSDRIG